MSELIQIQNLIYEIRGHKVILDSDLALLYGVSTKRLNEAVKRNLMRFSEVAIQINIQIIDTFVKMRQFVLENKDLTQRLADLKYYFKIHCNDYSVDIKEIHEAIDLLMDRTKPAKVGFIKTEELNSKKIR